MITVQSFIMVNSHLRVQSEDMCWHNSLGYHDVAHYYRFLLPLQLYVFCLHVGKQLLTDCNIYCMVAWDLGLPTLREHCIATLQRIGPFYQTRYSYTVNKVVCMKHHSYPLLKLLP